ncbi:MAG: hypothetical protein OXG44_01450 [Gammaproteobacteria bacterium]|nr:hypothetical protein [Gammaproteobacteria bacterium]
MTTNLDRSGGLANSNLMPGSAAGSGGGQTAEQVQALIDASQRVLVPNADGSYPAAQRQHLLVSNASLSIGHQSVTHTTRPTATLTAFVNANWLGVFTTGSRPGAGAGNLGRYLFNRSVPGFERVVGGYNPIFGSTQYGYAAAGTPFGLTFRGAWGSEDAALEHLQADGEAVIYGDEMYIASDFVAGVGRNVRLGWQPVTGGLFDDLENLRYWQNATAQGTPPNNVSQLTDQEIGEFVPVSFPSLAGTRYLHLGLLRPYEIDTIYIAGEERFSSFSTTQTTTDRYYHSPQLRADLTGIVDLLIRIREGDN